jgi:hypothetical protein
LVGFPGGFEISGAAMQMQMLYDTKSVHPLDRYDYYQAASATERAPGAVDGRAPGRLLAAMPTARIGDLELEHSSRPATRSATASSSAPAA